MLSRRKFIAGGVTLTAAGVAIATKPGDEGKNHNDYFRQLGSALERADIATPTLVIDRAMLRHNIGTLSGHIGNRFDYRVVAKSLPSMPLLQEVMAQANTRKLMLFHQPFVTQVARQFPDTDVLLGKPMPVTAAANFYRDLGDTGFNPERQLQWLVDTPERTSQYRDLAQDLNTTIRLSIELDVGLHRGGVQNREQLADMLNIIGESDRLEFAGFMGYEPHLVKIPGDTLENRDAAMAIYQGYVDAAEEQLGHSLARHTLNAAGSPTYQLYNQGEFPQTELAAGSCLVKPTDFDLGSLADHRPASFIATPVIKSAGDTRLPGADWLANMMSWWNPNRERTFFTYGGYWKAKPVSPQGLSINPVFGRSTNQEMYNGSSSIDLRPDDRIFFRPTQSEFVFLQFGDIAVYDDGEIVERWPVFT